jgi:hypothetical protein
MRKLGTYGTSVKRDLRKCQKSKRMTRLGRGRSSGNRTDIGCRISLPGTHDTERPIREFAVKRALAASRTRGMGATDGTRTTRPNSAIRPATTCGEEGGKVLNRRSQKAEAQLEVSVVTWLKRLLTMMDLPKSLLRAM